MRHLYLLRHGKSSWEDPGLADADRPLAPRGVRSLNRMAKHLRKAGVRPDLVICSPAVRARQTLAEIERSLPPHVTVQIEPEMYSGGSAGVAAVVRRVDDTVSSLMLIGHNPALQDLAVSLAVEGDEALRARLAEKLPTAALVVISLPRTAWHDLDQAGGTLEDLVLPRQLG